MNKKQTSSGNKAKAVQAQEPEDELLSSNFAPAGFSKSPGAKFIITGIITVLLLIPALLVWGLVEERADRAETVARTISKGWGDQQLINGPYLAIPYEVEVVSKNITNIETKYVLISPQQLNIESKVDVEERKKSIYSTPIYHVKSKLKGKFGSLDLRSVIASGKALDFENAFLAMGISDPAGFRSNVSIKINHRAAKYFEPGLKQLTNSHRHSRYSQRVSKMGGINSSGVNFDLKDANYRDGFDFEIDMALNGSRVLAIVPSGENTKLNITSNWPHPGFDGRFLPESRNINAKGFNAEWTIPNLARGISAVTFSNGLPLANSAMKINFVEPLKFYQLVSRTLKYAVAFFSLIFLAVFILEMTGKNSIHWIQYIFTGLAMVVFYVLLLALAEHVGFNIAYLVSAAATTALISWYIGDSLGQNSSSMTMAAVLATTYGVIFLVMKEQEYALLAGAIIAFLAIAATMMITRKVDWSGVETFGHSHTWSKIEK